jgi:prephenate dehydrogenase
MSAVLVVGCGLLGTSIGLALRGSPWDDVTLTDAAPHAMDEAARRGAGRPWDGRERAELAVVSVPPRATGAQLIELQRRDIASTYTHVASVQSSVQVEVEALSPDPSAIVGGHPLAGREVSGPAGAVADLFVGRPWAVCPTPRARAEAVAAVRVLAERCGAVPVEVSPDVHDATVALTSHVPQVVASALAGLLLTREEAQRLPLSLSGPGLADTTRLAASSPALWTEVLSANAAEVAPLLRALGSDLAGLADELDALTNEGPRADRSEGLMAFLERGNQGRARVPVKRGDRDEAFGVVRVELADAPGELARLLVDAGDAGVNVEDLRLEHVPGRPRGVVELSVSREAASALSQALAGKGWHVFLSTYDVSS